MGTDLYQKRYEAHQRTKKELLIELLQERHSTRAFAERDVDETTVKELLTSINPASSCDRQGIHISSERDRDRKATMSGMLVGGTGWLHRAPVVLMLWADPVAYKAGDEIRWNPYLDAGMVGDQLYLASSMLYLRGCFVNPNVRDFNQLHFSRLFSPLFGDPEDPAPTGLFCGAFALGWPR